MIPLERSPDMQRLVSSLSAELDLVRVGGDEALVPAYTLIAELCEILADDPEAHARCLELQELLGNCLENGGMFDESAVAGLKLFTEQIQCLLRYHGMDQPISWKELEEQWEPVAEQDDGADEIAPEPTVDAQSSMDDVISEELDCLMVLNLDSGNTDVLKGFHEEATEHLDNIEEALLQLETTSSNDEAVSSIFRSFHTIKGVAGFLHLDPVQNLAHEIETLLDLVRNHEKSMDEDLVSLVLESKDRLQALMDQLQNGLLNGVQPDRVIPVSDLIRISRSLIAGESPPPLTDDTALVQQVSEPAVTKEKPQVDVDNAGNSFTAEDLIKATEEKAAVEPPARKASAKHAESIRMNTLKLDTIIDAVGELVIVESQLRESISLAGYSDASIERNLAQLSRITAELQRSGLSLRMVSMKQLFQKMQRLARDLSRKSGKKVVFRTMGEETEMDRTVIEKISDPLVHMIRNALDHGIESPEERVAKGKDETGEIVLKAYYKGDNIMLDLTDDGGGIPSDKILKKAIQRGHAVEGRSYTREEILKFVFMPGFSTAAEVTDISGRGVGMDVVRSNVEKLSGRIELLSEEGKGSTVRICLPLTLAIIDGLVVRVGQDRYILPIMNVNITLKPESEQLFNVQSRGRVIRHRDRIYPIHSLAEFFGVESSISRPEDGVVIMLETEQMEYGLLVDEIVHKQEVVVKNLGGAMAQTAGVSGGAILGDGTISLILDPIGLTGMEQPEKVNALV